MSRVISGWAFNRIGRVGVEVVVGDYLTRLKESFVVPQIGWLATCYP